MGGIHEVEPVFRLLGGLELVVRFNEARCFSASALPGVMVAHTFPVYHQRLGHLADLPAATG